MGAQVKARPPRPRGVVVSLHSEMSSTGNPKKRRLLNVLLSPHLASQMMASLMLIIPIQSWDLRNLSEFEFQ